jgi:hypothetical protein
MANRTKQHDWAAIAGFAIQFSKKGENAGSEKSQTHDFIRAFLRIFGVAEDVGEFKDCYVRV